MTQIPRPSGTALSASEQEQPDAPSTPEDEARMRRALGLMGDEAGPRGAKNQAMGRTGGMGAARAGGMGATRGGGASVVVEHATLAKPERPGAAVNRLAGLEAQLLAERQARAQADRSLRDAQLALQDARTKQAHAEMARQDAEARVLALQAQLQALAAASPAPAAPAAVRAPGEAPRRRGRPPKLRPAPVPEAPPAAPMAEGEPVEWWQPGWKPRA